MDCALDRVGRRYFMQMIRDISFFFSRIFFLRIQDHWVLAIENQLIQHAFNTLCLISYLTKQYRWNAQQQLYLHSSPYSLQHFKEKTEIIYSSHRNRELVNLLVSTVTRCMSLDLGHHQNPQQPNTYTTFSILLLLKLLLHSFRATILKHTRS